MFGGVQVLDLPVQCKKRNTSDFYTSVILVKKKCVVAEEDVEEKLRTRQQENKQVKMQEKDE